MCSIPFIERYTTEIREIRQRLLDHSQVVDTARGPIEVAVDGDGPAVLSIHGGLGGYDQGLHAAHTLLGEGFRTIAPSRFGYLRTPLPHDASPAAMADALAALLDALRVPSVVVLGSSSGGPTAIEFAIRHPGRTKALVLNVCVVHAHPGISALARLNNSIGWRSDFLFWTIVETLGDRIGAQYGISTAYVKSLPPREQAYLRAIWRSANPVSQRRAGMLNDLVPRANDYPIEQITAPTLIVHARDDSINDFSHAAYAAEKIAGSRLFALDDGGHLKLGHRAAVKQAVRGFLADITGRPT